MASNRIAKYIAPTLSSQPVEMDPSAPGTIIRCAFALEAAFNLIGGIPMLFRPANSLSILTASSAATTPAATSLMQWNGALLLGLTPQLLLALPNTRSAVESRRLVYCTLGASELFLIPVLVWQALVEGEEASGLSPSAVMGFVAMVVPPLVWRCWVLFVKPEWLGRYREGGKEE